MPKKECLAEAMPMRDHSGTTGARIMRTSTNSEFARHLSCTMVWLLICCGAATAAPPSNDNFANAILLTGNSGTATVSVAEATFETSEPNDPYCPQGTAWYKWVAPAAGELIVQSGGEAETGYSCAFIFVGTTVGSL